MSKRYQGNIITDSPVEPSGPYEDSAASGVWSLAEAEAYTRGGLWPTAGNTAPVGLFTGGFTGSASVASIDKILFATAGNATDYGDMSAGGLRNAAVGSSTRMVTQLGNSGGNVNTLEYGEFATSANTVDFGDLTVARSAGTAFSSSTRGIWAAGSSQNTIDYITIASTGNALDFGDCLSPFNDTPGGCASTTRGVMAGGQSNTLGDYSNVIQYVTIDTTGNMTDFGDLTVGRNSLTGGIKRNAGCFCWWKPSGLQQCH